MNSNVTTTSLYKKLISVAEHNDPQIIDLATNTNPLALPEIVKQAIITTLDFCTSYPDARCQELSNAIANSRHIDSNQVLCGNGADDLIYRIVNTTKPQRAVILAPTFEEYEKALKTVDCQVIYHYLQEENDFTVTDKLLQDLTPDVDMMYLCNPNNPTGQLVNCELMHKILDHCYQNKIVLIVDECFNGFLDSPEQYSYRQFIDEYPNLIIIEAFTKLYAMAGLRLGFCMSSDLKLLKQIHENGQEWNVSIPAQAAGIAALNDTKYLFQTRNLIKAERKWLTEKLANLKINIIGSHANYIFFRSPITNLRQKLNRQNILIRNCENFRGLDGEFCRVAIKTHVENAKFIEALKILLQM